jgi:hypothetical protein
VKPLYIVSDRGKEFVNNKFQIFLKKNDVGYFSANNDDTKACIAERFIRTIKELIFKYLTSKNTLRYIDVLESLTYAYNHRKHSSIGMAPADVSEKNILEVWKQLRKNRNIRNINKKPKFRINEYVRVSKTHHIFSKGYMPNFSDEVFVIKEVLTRDPIVYKLKDLQEEDVDGTFYEEELQSIIKNKNSVYRVESVLKIRHNKGRREAFVAWKGWPKKFNSWIPYENIQH